MSLGNHLFNARKNKGLSQEAVAEKLGVSRQTISKWETDETLPDIRQSKRLAMLYGLSLDELIEFDLDIREIQDVIDRTSEAVSGENRLDKGMEQKIPRAGPLPEPGGYPLLRGGIVETADRPGKEIRLQ